MYIPNNKEFIIKMEVVLWFNQNSFLLKLRFCFLATVVSLAQIKSYKTIYLAEYSFVDTLQK